MSTLHKNLSQQTIERSEKLRAKKIAIVVSEWNSEITESLYAGAMSYLMACGISRDNIIRKVVPGSFELSLGSQWMAKQSDIDAVIAIGCVIQGETRHFDFICQSVALGLSHVGLTYNKPVIFGVLTTDNMQQALDRAGGKYGNKGDEAAATAVKMLLFEK